MSNIIDFINDKSIHINDIVEVINYGATYTSYISWSGLKNYVDCFVNEEHPNNNVCYKVLNLGKHDLRSNKDIALIQDFLTKQVYIIDVNAIKRVKRGVSDEIKERKIVNG